MRAEASDELGLDVEEMQQVENLLQCIQHFLRLARRKTPVAEIRRGNRRASREVGAVGADFERVRGQADVGRAIDLETLEIGEPRVDAARASSVSASALYAATCFGARASTFENAAIAAARCPAGRISRRD